MTTLTEYETEKLDSECDLSGLHQYLVRHQLEKALKINPDGTAKATSYVGAICYKGTQIKIVPKLLSPDNDNENSIMLRNLTHMLAYTRKLDIKVSDNVKLNHCRNPFLEVLIRAYATSLFDALKKHTPKIYITQEENLCYLKGKLKIAENIRYNIANAAKFYCAYDEFSEDNPLNRLFYFVSTLLSKITEDKYNQRTLCLIKNHYVDILLMPMSYAQAEKIVLARNQSIFAKPLKLALMFLQNASIDFSKNKIQNMALLWDMNKLFEEYVYELMRRKCAAGYIISSQKSCDVFFDSKEHSSKVDILVEKENGTKLVIDTKYKRVKKVGDADSNDIYQVTAYCLLYQAHQAILLYPKWTDDINQNRHLNTDTGKYYIRFYSIDLHCDLSEKENEITENLNKILADEQENILTAS